MKRLCALFLILSFCFAAVSCSAERTSLRPLAAVAYPDAIGFDDHDTRRANRDTNPVSEDFYVSLRNFSYNTAAGLLTGSKNLNFSPLSLYFALSLAGTGAEGETRTQIFSLLGAADTQTLSEQCGNLYRLLYTDDAIAQLKIANSLWLQSGDPNQPAPGSTVFRESFVKNAVEHFYASAWEVDFADPETGKAMGKWISENTNGLLSPKFTIDPQQILSIINTVYFHDEWIDRFDKSLTGSGVFHTPDGAVSVDYMHRTVASGGFSRGDGFTRAALGLKGSGSMSFILPDEGVTLESLLGSAESLRTLFEGGESFSGQIVWQVPKFSTASDLNLRDTLVSLGVTDAFSENADFSGITDGAAFLSSVAQQTRISIDENGVEAAAFTKIDYAGSAMPVDRAEMILNRPFLYGVTAADGTLLFVGVCADPSK